MDIGSSLERNTDCPSVPRTFQISTRIISLPIQWPTTVPSRVQTKHLVDEEYLNNIQVIHPASLKNTLQYNCNFYHDAAKRVETVHDQENAQGSL
jgi:hypothetical protein